MAGLDTGISEVLLETLELIRRNGFAYEIGRYQLGLDPPRDPVVDRGKYVRVHEQQPDGSWLWAVEMFNPAASIPSRADHKHARRTEMTRCSSTPGSRPCRSWPA